MSQSERQGMVEFFFPKDSERPKSLTVAKKALRFDLQDSPDEDFMERRLHPDGAEAEGEKVLQLGTIAGIRGDGAIVRLTVVYREDVFHAIKDLGEEEERIEEAILRIREEAIGPRLADYLEGFHQIKITSEIWAE